jgi:hypothetical protein
LPIVGDSSVRVDKHTTGGFQDILDCGHSYLPRLSAQYVAHSCCNHIENNSLTGQWKVCLLFAGHCRIDDVFSGITQHCTTGQSDSGSDSSQASGSTDWSDKPHNRPAGSSSPNTTSTESFASCCFTDRFSCRTDNRSADYSTNGITMPIRVDT